MSLVGALFSSLYDASTDVTHHSVPALQFNVDYGLAETVSIGGAFSFQSLGAEIRNYSYEAKDGSFKTAPILDLNINRINIAARFLFHYNTNNDAFDVYSGARLGYTFWNSSHNLNDAAGGVEDEIWPRGNVFAPQLVLIGFRGYFIDNLGANFELAIGAPHYISMGLNYKI
jgi:opacity protein-like surface antigen